MLSRPFHNYGYVFLRVTAHYECVWGASARPPRGCPIEEATKGDRSKSAIGAIAPVEVQRFFSKYITIFTNQSTKSSVRTGNNRITAIMVPE